METTQEWMNVPKAAKLLGVPRSRMYDLVAKGHVPAVRVGERSIRINRQELERYLMEQCRVVTR